MLQVQLLRHSGQGGWMRKSTASNEYSDPPDTGPSGIRMIIFWTLLKSGFQMVKGSHFVKTILKPDIRVLFSTKWWLA
jgi:hypothetical protein